MATILRGCFFLFAALGPAWAQSSPTNFRAEVKGPTEVFLSWDQVAGTTGYHVWRALGSATFVRLTSAKIAAPSYTDAAASPGITYRYRVVAVASDGQTYGSVLTITTPELLVASRKTVRPRPRPPGAPPRPGLTDAAQNPETPTPADPSASAGQTPGIPVTAQAVPAGGGSPSGSTAGTPVATSIQSQAHRAAPAPTLSEAAKPSNPALFWSERKGNKIVLSWSPVPGVCCYLLGGPGMGPQGQEVEGTLYEVELPEKGKYEWTVASLAGKGQGPLTNWTEWPKHGLYEYTDPFSSPLW